MFELSTNGKDDGLRIYPKSSAPKQAGVLAGRQSVPSATV